MLEMIDLEIAKKRPEEMIQETERYRLIRTFKARKTSSRLQSKIGEIWPVSLSFKNAKERRVSASCQSGCN